MDPVSHAVIGMGAYVIWGGEPSMADPGFLGCVAGSLAPDLDIVAKLKNDYHYLRYHRGISHSFVGCGILSAGIALILNILFPAGRFVNILLWAYMGCMSHIIFDTLNSYGAKLFWPLSNRKYSLSILRLFDIIVFGLCSAVLVSRNEGLHYKGAILAIFFIYLVMQGIMRYTATKKVATFLKGRVGIESIKILPSLSGFFKWDFVIMSWQHCTVGQVNLLSRDVRIREKLRRIGKKERDRLLKDKAGKFFREFTPIFHVKVKKRKDKVEVMYTDLRYRLRDKFMHHATAVYNKNGMLVKTVFHPYSKKNSIPF